MKTKDVLPTISRIHTVADKQAKIDVVWDMIVASYQNRGGVEGFTQQMLTNDRDTWYLVTSGETVHGGVITKPTKGEKVRLVFNNGTEQGRIETKHLLNALLFKAWGEFSGKMINTLMSMNKHPMSNQIAVTVFGRTVKKLHEDGIHYDREVMPGVVKTLVLVGQLNKTKP